MCGYCNITNIDKFDSPFDEKDADDLAAGVFAGFVTKYSLPSSVYKKTSKKLKEAVKKGFGTSELAVEFGTPDYIMLADLTENIYMFSGAKTYQTVRSMTSLLKDEKLASSYSAFKKEAMKIFDNFNQDYLEAEYNTAIASSQSAAEWQRIVANKDILPLLQYQTAGDMRVRPTHAELDNIVRPVEDGFWDNYYPPNGWNCRCTTIQLSKGEEKLTDMRGFKKPEDVPEEFMMNSGKDKIIFSPKHPYFKVAKGDKNFAKTNFGFGLPSRDV